MRFRSPRRLGHVVDEAADEPVVYLCPLPLGPATALSGSAAVIWLSASAGVDDVPAAVAREFEIDVSDIRTDVEGFLDYLVGAGFLEAVS